ncbi:transmembrane protein 26-like isoform X3 [Lepisosteus oculatus]|uniref:transmembrane protein 26-like isoform X3 n=1 Tax=Lepisosteus oculatus TaxID=7918 RepID=UPI00371FEF98
MCKFLNVLLATLSRLLFAVHGVLTVWRVVTVKGDPVYWLLLLGVALLGVEMGVTLKFTRSGEWKCLMQSRMSVNTSLGSDPYLPASIPIPLELSQLEPQNWVLGLEQTMLIVLVLGRWLMPKGDLSRDQLSQLLMVYVGLGADILDIFEIFKEKEVENNLSILVTGLSLFTWALMQFPLVLTQTSPSQCHLEDPDSRPDEAVGSCCSSEVWSLLVTVGMQDGPFLIYRLYLIVQEGVLNQSMIFFTCKNILIVLIEIYRIIVVQCSKISVGVSVFHSTSSSREARHDPEAENWDSEHQK